MNDAAWVCLGISLTIIIGGGFALLTTNNDYKVENVEILEITYLPESFTTFAQTIIRCHNETYAFRDIQTLPLGNVTIYYKETGYDYCILKDWRRIE